MTSGRVGKLACGGRRGVAPHARPQTASAERELRVDVLVQRERAASLTGYTVRRLIARVSPRRRGGVRL
jgi:hypothetical protein